MKISGRNQIKATVKAITQGGVMSQVVLDFNGAELVSVITNDSARDLEIQVGDAVTAVIKSTSVMLMK
jgi:molybdopterin-binding protein